MQVTMTAALKALKEYGQKPAKYLASCMEDHDVILLGEHHAIHDNIQCLIDAIPVLYEAGMDVLGMEFGCAEDQSQLDALLCGSLYDEDKARALMFNYNTLFAYQTYQEVYRAVFEFNQTLPAHKKKLTILNLSYRYRWHAIEGSVQSISQMKTVFHRGGTEWFRFNRIKEHVIKPNKKMVALVGNIHAYTDYHVPVLDYLSKDFIRFENRHLGHLLKQEGNVRVKTVLFHEYFPALEPGKHVQPAGGLIEKVMRENDDQPVGFDLKNTDLGEINDHSQLALGRDVFKLKDLTDGYIFLKPLQQRQGARVDKRYLNGKTLEDVLANFPDPNWHEKPSTVDAYWDLVSAYVDLTKRYQPI